MADVVGSPSPSDLDGPTPPSSGVDRAYFRGVFSFFFPPFLRSRPPLVRGRSELVAGVGLFPSILTSLPFCEIGSFLAGFLFFFHAVRRTPPADGRVEGIFEKEIASLPSCQRDFFPDALTKDSCNLHLSGWRLFPFSRRNRSGNKVLDLFCPPFSFLNTAMGGSFLRHWREDHPIYCHPPFSPPFLPRTSGLFPS